MSKIKKTALVCSIGIILGLVLNSSSELRTSQAGMELIANKEGCTRNPYKCSADMWTVGIGSTEAGKMKIEKGKIYSDREIAERFTADLKIAEYCVNTHFKGEKMNQGQFEAMVSLTFNIGCPNAKSYYHKGLQQKVPTTLYKLAQLEQFSEMCNRITDFNRAGGKVLKGLQIRREAERLHCLGKNNVQ